MILLKDRDNGFFIAYNFVPDSLESCTIMSAVLPATKGVAPVLVSSEQQATA